MDRAEEIVRRFEGTLGRGLLGRIAGGRLERHAHVLDVRRVCRLELGLVRFVVGADLLRVCLGLGGHGIGTEDEVADRGLRGPLLIGLFHFRFTRTESPLHPALVILEEEPHLDLRAERRVVGTRRLLVGEKLPLVDLAVHLEERRGFHAAVHRVFGHGHAPAVRVRDPEPLPDQLLEEVPHELALLVVGQLPARAGFDFLEIGPFEPIPLALAQRNPVDDADHVGRASRRRTRGRAARRLFRRRGGRRRESRDSQSRSDDQR